MVEIAKLSKHDLLLMLRDQEIEIKNLKAENGNLQSQISELQAQIASLQEKPEQEIGSIAEESIKVSGVMLAAQRAADEYVLGLKARYESLETETNKMIEETQVKCNKMEFESRYKADLAWDSLKKKLDDYCMAHAELENLLGRTQSIVDQMK